MTSSAASRSLAHCRFAVVDVETTGSGPQSGGRILEVAVAMLEDGTVHLAYDALLDPGVPIPPAVVRLTGITDRLVAGRPRFGDVAPTLGRVLEDAVFVAHNARFDWAFLAAECAAAGVPAPRGAPLCTIRLTRRLAPELRHRWRHARTRNAERGTRNISGSVGARATVHDSSAFRVPRSDF